MLKSLLFFLILTLIITGCQQRLKQEKAESDTVKNSFFPVTKYLLGQINELDSLPVTFLKITTTNRRADSAWINRENVRDFTQPFVSPLIDSQTYYRYFSEKSFLDQTINAYTFSYDPVQPLPGGMEVKHWDIYVDPATQKVTRIYIVKESAKDTAAKITQLIWKAGYYCQITTIVESKGSVPQVKEEKLLWNFNN